MLTAITIFDKLDFNTIALSPKVTEYLNAFNSLNEVIRGCFKNRHLLIKKCLQYHGNFYKTRVPCLLMLDTKC